MSTPLLVLIGTERSRSLATSALPDAPSEPRPAAACDPASRSPDHHGERTSAAATVSSRPPADAGYTRARTADVTQLARAPLS